jgi:PKHD-type hydroxylase
MNLHLANVLDASALSTVWTALSRTNFTDGAATAGWHAKGVKQNLQADCPEAAQVIREALARHALFRAAVMPLKIRQPLFSRYATGMRYGVHVDDAFMAAGAESLRSDVAVTVFLSDPKDYDGGELVIESASGVASYKLPAGHAVAYPETTLHRVDEVTRGERNVALLWVQSHVREPAQRELLFDVDTVRRRLFETAGGKKSPEFDLLSKTYANLLRAWSSA